MSTRGAMGFYKDGNHKVTYNHFNSYPSALGVDVLKFAKSFPLVRLNQMFDEITMIDQNLKPTKEQKEKVGNQFLDLTVSEQTDDDWYCLLRGAQGELHSYATAGFMPDSQDFLHDSLFCEYAYVINLDDETLEVYEGFQKSKPKGRYANVKPDDGYYAVGLVKEYPLAKLPNEKTFLSDLAPEDDE